MCGPCRCASRLGLLCLSVDSGGGRGMHMRVGVVCVLDAGAIHAGAQAGCVFACVKTRYRVGTAACKATSCASSSPQFWTHADAVHTQAHIRTQVLMHALSHTHTHTCTCTLAHTRSHTWARACLVCCRTTPSAACGCWHACCRRHSARAAMAASPTLRQLQQPQAPLLLHGTDLACRPLAWAAA